MTFVPCRQTVTAATNWKVKPDMKAHTDGYHRVICFDAMSYGKLFRLFLILATLSKAIRAETIDF